jgi:dynein heavy chain
LFFGNLSFVFFLQSYYDVRAEIEQSGRDSRWEFDNKRLFKLTDHMAIICNDFIAIAKELEQFYNIFTPELKSVTGKPHKINEILERVHKVLELIEHVKTFSIIKLFLVIFIFLQAPCDPFRLEDHDKWKMVADNYAQQIEEIDEQTKSFISESFKTLR